MTQMLRTWVRLQVIEALKTIPALRVTSPGKWDAVPQRTPEARVRATGDRKLSTGRQHANFTTTAVVEVQLFIEANTPEAAQTAIEALCFLVENVVMGYYPLRKETQQFAAVTTRQDVDTDGAKPMGSAVLAFDVESFESFEPFDNTGRTPVDLNEIQTTLDLPGEATPLVLLSTVSL